VYVPTGRLAFHISEYVATQWVDGRRKLEDRLDIVAKHVYKVDLHRRYAEAERERAAEAARVAALRKQQEAEKARFDLLVRQMQDWELSTRIHVFVDEVEQRLLAANGRIDTGSQADEWISWAREQADRLDPLRAP
jgi:hypothetical protein